MSSTSLQLAVGSRDLSQAVKRVIGVTLISLINMEVGINVEGVQKLQNQ